MKIFSFPALALLLAIPLLDGCRRKKVEPSAPLAPAAPPPAAGSADAPVASAPAAGSPPAGPAVRRAEPSPAVYEVDASVQRVLTKFYKDHERPAMTWEELLKGKYISAIPLGPDGKPLDWNTTMQRIGKASARPRQ